MAIIKMDIYDVFKFNRHENRFADSRASGYFVNFGFNDSSVSFVNPVLRDDFPKDIESCSFDWCIADDSLVYRTNYGLTLRYKIRTITQDTLILKGAHGDFIHIRFPIKDTTFYPNVKKEQ